jgi:uncharacterized membrane protein YkvA (DUF1232 family)
MEYDFAQHYSERRFWDKIVKYANLIGKKGLKKALILFYTLQDPENKVPAWAKTVVIGALAYLIFPVDGIPDLAPIIGYTDDLAVLAAAAGTIAIHIPHEAKARAKEKLKEWFGE